MKKEEFYQEAYSNTVGPLEGVRILEATTTGAGPFAGTLLVDQGAECIKCDLPITGDILRHVPPFVKSTDPLEASCFHLSINRNKKCITLDFKMPEGKEIFKELAKKVDIIIENFKPGTMDEWGLGYKDVKKVKPDIIYTSVSGFGQYGPLHHKPGYDPVGQAMGGLMSVTGYPNSPPTRTGNAVADNTTGWLGAFGSLAALYYRMRTGKGQHVDACLLDSILYMSDIGIIGAANANYVWKRRGSRHPVGAPCNTYECQDDYVLIAAVLERHWLRLCKAIGREDLIDDPRTNTPAGRAENVDFVDEVINQWTKNKKVAEVIELFDEAGLVASPILSFQQIIKNEHIREREMVVDIEHPTAGTLTIYGTTPKFSLTPGRVRSPAPRLGEHCEEIYGGLLGYSKEKIAELKAKRVI